MAAWPSRHRSHAGVPPSRCVRLLGGDPNGCELPTLPKTNVAAENVVSRKERMIVYQLLIFRGYVKLRGCNWNHFQRWLYKWLLKSNQPCVSGFPSFFEISPLGNLLRKRGATSPCCTVWSRDHRTPNTTWRQPYVCHVTLLDGNKLRLPSSTGSPEWEPDGVSASKKKTKNHWLKADFSCLTTLGLAASILQPIPFPLSVLIRGDHLWLHLESEDSSGESPMFQVFVTHTMSISIYTCDKKICPFKRTHIFKVPYM